MILSVSRRTDIPASSDYSNWFIDKIRNGYLYVRNPMYQEKVSKITLSPDVIDCIVFWTKDASGMLPHLDKLKDYQYYFQYTLNTYGKEIEPLAQLNENIEIFKELSRKIGKDRIIWRYDPIAINETYTVEKHIENFGLLANALKEYTNKVVISFIDMYPCTVANTNGLNLREPIECEMEIIAKEFSKIAKLNNLIIESCAEKINLEKYGIEHGHCIDKEFIENLVGYKLTGGKDKSQRKECGCMESIDIGKYDTCLRGCKYCYANNSNNKVINNYKLFSATSPFLCDIEKDTDIIHDKKMKSLKRKR